MVKKILSKDKAEKEIKVFFENINKKTSKEIKKIKRLSMRYNIKLKEKRKKFCQKCYSSKLRVKSIKKGIKTVECEKCGKISRYKLKN
tara:strand:+ start:635 stop:898 length:264 start_codon:yes stop_codon:yes gene_type:complete